MNTPFLHKFKDGASGCFLHTSCKYLMYKRINDIPAVAGKKIK
jgi:hypothetical protein